MTTGDLVRNEIFSKVAATNPAAAEELDMHLWQPFYNSFRRGEQDTFEGFFFPFGLIQDPSFKKSEVYNGLRRLWRHPTPREVMEQLNSYRFEYQDLVFGENAADLPPVTSAAVNRLARLDFPRVALPFLMSTTHAVRVGQLDPGRGAELLSSVEAFLVRRALCSLEPTGLHTVFKRLWVQLDEDYTPEAVETAIRQAKTVSVPRDADVIEALRKPLYGKNVAKFFVYEYDLSMNGDPGSYEGMWIEHVLPQSYHEETWGQFTKPEHDEMADLAGNLIPLSQQMNQGWAAHPTRPRLRSTRTIPCSNPLGSSRRPTTPGGLRISRRGTRPSPSGRCKGGGSEPGLRSGQEETLLESTSFP